MNLEHYKQRLLSLEAHLTGRVTRDTARGRGLAIDGVGDTGDISVDDQTKGLDFAEAELDSGVLSEVQDALARITAGTFGRCLADDEPIEKARLDAVPWAKYCVAHQAALEAGSVKKRTTL